MVYYNTMACTVDKRAYSIKRNDILDAALRLIVAGGYEGMSIQDILSILGISKGNFYHYFHSKSALLAALLERMLSEMEKLVEPIAKDPDSTAAAAIKKFFDALAGHKAGQRSFVSGVLKGWYGDDNAIVREKMRTAFCARLAPYLAGIIRQGCDRHEFTVSEPDQAARIVFALTQDLSDTIARSIAFDKQPETPAWVLQAIASTTEAIERVLCASPGSISITERNAIELWFVGRGSPQHEI